MLATNDPSTQFRDYVLAPPMVPRLIDADGRWHVRPFVYPLRVVDRLERRFAEVTRGPCRWRLRPGRLIAPLDANAGPWLPLGADRSARDGWSRLIVGARRSLGVALLASLGALALGLAIGVVAGYAGRLDRSAAMRTAELVLGAARPLCRARGPRLAAVNDPAIDGLHADDRRAGAARVAMVARGVRAIVAREALQEFAVAARAIGASPAPGGVATSRAGRAGVRAHARPAAPAGGDPAPKRRSRSPVSASRRMHRAGARCCRRPPTSRC